MAYLTEALQRITTRTALKGGWRSATMTGDETLTVKSSQFQRLDPGGADRTVTLPSVGTDDGYFFVVANAADAAETITVEDADASTVVEINQGEIAIVY